MTASPGPPLQISRITDDHLNTIPKSGPWKVGSVHPARVIGFSALDNLVQLSLQPSVLEQAFLRVQDVEVGAEVKGTVKVLKENALFVSIGGNVDGVVWPLHYADIRLKHPEKKFKPGQAVKARIFSADADKNRVVLTLKKQLVNSDLPIVARHADAKPGAVTHATVTKVLEKSVLVDFFGGLRALIPAAEAAEAFTEASDLARLFPLGKVVAVHILSVDPSTSRIVASARQASAPSVAATASGTAALEALDIGTVTSATVQQLHDTILVLSLVPSGVKALLSYPTLARHRGVQVPELKASLAKGQTLEDLVVVSKNIDKGFVIVGLLPSKSASSSAAASTSTSSSAPLTLDSLKVGALYPGRIASRLPSGVVLVQLASAGRHAPRGRVALTELADSYADDLASAFPVGTTVDAVVLVVDSEQNRLDLSLRASRVAQAKGDGEAQVPEVQDRVIESVEQLKAGDKVRGFVKNVANAGLFVTLGGEVTARVQIKVRPLTLGRAGHALRR